MHAIKITGLCKTCKKLDDYKLGHASFNNCQYYSDKTGLQCRSDIVLRILSNLLVRSSDILKKIFFCSLQYRYVCI